jgi:hypothetical protein
MKSVYSAVRTGSLNKAVCVSSLKGLNVVVYIRLISELKALFSDFDIRTVSTNRGKALAIRHCDVSAADKQTTTMRE